MGSEFWLTILFLFAAPVPSNTTSGPVSAAPASESSSEPHITLTPGQAGRFSTALAAVTGQTHTTIIAEGEPLHPTPGATNTPPLTASLPLSEAVARIAAAYDYDVQRQGNVFLLTKRYSDPEDLPNITIDEYLGAKDDIAQITSDFNPQIPPPRYQETDPLVGEIAASLTPEQLQAMHETTPDRGLSVASLNAHQQALVSHIALYYYVQDAVMEMGDVTYNSSRLSHAAFCWHNVGTRIHDFCLSVPSDTGEEMIIPYTHPHLLQTVPATNANQNAVWNKFMADPTDPPAGSTPPDVRSAPPPTLTLGQLVAQITPSGADKPQFAVEKSLRDKVLSAFGASNADPEAIIQAVSALYDLRLRTRADKVKELCRPPCHVPLEISEMPEAILQALPTPYLRALHLQERQDLLSQIQADNNLLMGADQSWAMDGQPTSKSGTGTPDAGSAAPAAEPSTKPLTPEQYGAAWQARWRHDQELSDQADKLKNRPIFYRDKGVQKLRIVLDPILMPDPRTSVPLSQLGPREQQDFANVLMGNYMKQVQRLVTTQVPPFINHFDQVFLTGGRYRDENGKPKFSLFLSMPSPDGSRLEQKVGRGNVFLKE